MKLVCPNCQKVHDGDFTIEDIGRVRCGDCAQAGVRPRELYVLELMPLTWFNLPAEDIVLHPRRRNRRTDDR